MTEQQKTIARELLSRAYHYGFGARLPLQPVADKTGIPVKEIFDKNTESGIMYEFSQWGHTGLFDFSTDSKSVRAETDTLNLAEHWSDFRR